MKGLLKTKRKVNRKPNTVNRKPLELTPGLYFGMVSFICFFMGFMLFGYCIYYRIKFSEIENILFWPIHYLVLAVGCLVVSLYHKVKSDITHKP